VIGCFVKTLFLLSKVDLQTIVIVEMAIQVGVAREGQPLF
jgi:hypothetical protein